MIAGIVFGFLGVTFDQALNNLSWAWQAALVYIGGFLLCTNPFATAFTTKMIEEGQGTLFFFTTQVSSGGSAHTIPLVSPWIVYVLFYIAVSALLILSSILIVRHKRG